MRRDDSGRIILSASDLMRFQGCMHATTLDLKWLDAKSANGEDCGLRPTLDSDTAALLQKKGNAHEQAYLAELKTSGIAVHEIETKRASFADAHQQTVRALKSGRPAIYQSALAGGVWAGYADFLERVERPSRLGDFSYEVIDTKLKASPAPNHVLQLALYSDLLAEIQGREPEHIHVVLGTGERATLRLADYIHYARHLRRRLEAFVSAPPPTRALPCSACSLCRWSERCIAEWDDIDSLTLVAGIRRSQQRKLEAAGVTTLADLAATERKVPALATETLGKLREQARLQHARRQGGPPSFVLRSDVEPALGLGRMPSPAAGDLFFDMEGDPLIEGGLEYLFGVYVEGATAGEFKIFWAHSHAEERQATRDVLEYFDAHIRANADAHIYHYNHYEVTALKRLVAKHGVGEAKLDRLLREQRFVDLYRVVQQGLITSEPGYSIKNLEVFYAEARTEDVTSAGDSIVVYEQWRETGDPALLDGIRAYNEFDCRSTKGLRDWLVSDVRPAGLAWFKSTTIKDNAASATARSDAEESERQEWRQLAARSGHGLGCEAAELLFELTWFHKREDKPQWWAMFDRAERETGELVDDLDSLAGLTADGGSWPDARSLVRRYRFPAQDTKLREGARVRARTEGLPGVTIAALDADDRTVDVKFGPTAGQPPDHLDLVPAGPIGNEVLRSAVARVVANALAGEQSYPAIEAIATRQLPSIAGVDAGSALAGTSDDTVDVAVELIGRLQSSYLPIQGPPGTGKTYLASCAILALLKAGKRVAVTSNSHKAIDNLLLAVADRADDDGFKLEAIKKSEDGETLTQRGIGVTNDNNDARLMTLPLVGGTAWLLARPEHDRRFDYLFVDEAGQVSLANVVAAGAAAHNIVLIGDPMQLAQPIQGTHPGQSGASSLGFVLDDAATVPVERGVFLPVSRRMHPAICAYISDVVYDGRLSSDVAAARQRLEPEAELPEAGIRFVAIEHEGNGQSSEEEAAAIKQLYRRLIGRRFRNRDGRTRKLTSADILVVAPYNAQVNLLARRLPADARVGTVDKFQGQEAPVCIVSMTTSSADELPRDIEFLFSVNRLNVAISRAQALSIVVASPRLLEVPCRTIGQMRLVNALCAVAAYSDRLQATAGSTGVMPR